MTSPDLKTALFRRFDRYARLHTTSDRESDSVPSSERQLVLSRLLHDELQALDIATDLDQHGYVYARLAATAGYEEAPPIGFIAHVDTSPDVRGDNVVPRRHPAYEGGDISISADLVLSPDSSPELVHHLGHELVTASGTTLLGADNKAGIAIIMTLAERLKSSQEPHGPVRIAFTVDEEIGRGMDHFQVDRFGAAYAYTIDGGTLGHVEYECFHADSVEITVTGRSIHPGSAKNQMANAAMIAAEIMAAWPDHLQPGHTEGREGFIMLSEIEGNVETARVRGIARDHDLAQLTAHKALLDSIVESARRKHPRATIQVSYGEQYRNMRQIIDQHPQVMDKLQAAFQRLELPMHVTPIRGGTDGSRLSFMGIPTPNIFTGGSNYHSRDEWVSLDSMATCVNLLERLLSEWTT